LKDKKSLMRLQQTSEKKDAFVTNITYKYIDINPFLNFSHKYLNENLGFTNEESVFLRLILLISLHMKYSTVVCLTQRTQLYI